MEAQEQLLTREHTQKKHLILLISSLSKSLRMIDVDNSEKSASANWSALYVEDAIWKPIKQIIRDTNAKIAAKEAMTIKTNIFGGLTPRHSRLLKNSKYNWHTKTSHEKC